MACKYLRRRCAPDCVLTSYFPVSQPSPLRRRPPGLWRQQSRKVARGSSYSLPVDERAQAAETMAMEAQWLVEDPVYGCDGIISQLQEEIQPTQCKLTRTRAQLAIVPVHGA
ncbi:unnamed protein product [Triticum turgidum subsp. durum]|uniref:LOB domain-containing protein n=1 Tax=Triticum turgidum subsp. durum TaxID=4567 RepID=A0A9R0X3M6_TRITD|nr:unnamed protein product [Triticum turgidum subsp. durum]